MSEGTTAIGQKDDAAVTDPALSASMIALLKGLLTQSNGSAAGTPDANVITVQGDPAGSPVPVIGKAYSASASFTPAATSHTAGDVNGAAGTFALAAISGSRIMITSASLEIDGGTTEVTAWRLYLYSVTPPSALTDTNDFLLASGDRASFLGYVDLGTAVDIGDTQWVETNIINKQVKLAGTGLFGYLVNLTTLTPANVAHIVTLHAVGL
jgi:hypothetical protein